LETELQQSLSPELQGLLSPEIALPAISERRATRGKDVSSSYSSLIPKGRDKTTSIPFNEPVLEPPTIRKPDAVLSFCIIIDH